MLDTSSQIDKNELPMAVYKKIIAAKYCFYIFLVSLVVSSIVGAMCLLCANDMHGMFIISKLINWAIITGSILAAFTAAVIISKLIHVHYNEKYKSLEPDDDITAKDRTLCCTEHDEDCEYAARSQSGDSECIDDKCMTEFCCCMVCAIFSGAVAPRHPLL